jgi:hypothetical protein
MTKTNERSGMSLRILEIIMAGSLAFSIMDQFTGGWSISEKSFLRPVLQEIFDIPGMWLLFSLLLWGFFGGALFFFMRWMERVNAKAIGTRMKLDIPCNMDAVKKFLSSKNIVTHAADIFHITNLIKVCWQETDKHKWLGNKPRIELVYDEKNGFLLSAFIEVTRPTPETTSMSLQKAFLLELQKAGVFAQSPVAI